MYNKGMTNRAIVPASTSPRSGQLVDPAYQEQLTQLLRAVGQAANQVGAHHVFTHYRSLKAENTLRRQDADLRAFEAFLNEVLRSTGANLHIPVDALRQDPAFWRGVTWGLVEAFVQNRLQLGYAVSTVNFQLSTVKVYAGLAAQAGELPKTELPLIQSVKAIRHSEAVRLDEKRAAVRVGSKKSSPTELTDGLAEALIDQRTDTPQGRRDRLLMCLLLRHGLRVSEIVRLKAEAFDLEKGVFRFYRPKVNKTQIHEMTEDTWSSARSFFQSGDAPSAGPLFTESNSNGKLDRQRRGVQMLTTRGVNERVHHLGMVVGIDTLSPHDCRHYWATRAAEDGTPLERLKQAGGWNSVHMPVRYINDSAIANQGMAQNNAGKKKAD
jgi:integrase